MSKRHCPRRWQASGQRGSITVLSATSLLGLVAVGALAIEVGQLMVARNELQNAADATAMAGAACLAPRAECANLTVKGPDWTQAAERAQAFVPRNAVQSRALASAEVETGYWDMLDPQAQLLPQTFTPGDYHYAAVRVTVTRAPGVNGGGLLAPLAHLFGVQDVRAQASAVAVLSYPGTALPGTLFPLAISRCMYDNFWDATTGAPRLATQETMPGLDLPQVVGEPIRFKVTSSYRAGPCESGQWSSLLLNDNSVATLRQLITGGNLQSLSIGDGSWIQPGVQATLYTDVNQCSEAGNRKCAWVMVPVVDVVATRISAPVRGFACLHLLRARGGNEKYIAAQMSNDEDRCASLGSGVGPNYGISTPPRLVQ